jgi:hypothetical protein
MKIRDIIDYLRSDMNLLVMDYNTNINEAFVVYEGAVQDVPYWIVEQEFTAEECIEAEGNSLFIDISKPSRSKNIETSKAWDEREEL